MGQSSQPCAGTGVRDTKDTICRRSKTYPFGQAKGKLAVFEGLAGFPLSAQGESDCPGLITGRRSQTLNLAARAASSVARIIAIIQIHTHSRMHVPLEIFGGDRRTATLLSLSLRQQTAAARAPTSTERKGALARWTAIRLDAVQ